MRRCTKASNKIAGFDPFRQCPDEAQPSASITTARVENGMGSMLICNYSDIHDNDSYIP